MAHIVITPLVIAKTTDGTNVHLYFGAPVPANVSKEEVARLVEGGFIQSDAPDDTWTVPALKGYAADNGIDLGDATKKADILAAIAAKA